MAAKLPNMVRGDTYPVSIDLSAYGISIVGHKFSLTLKDDLIDADADAALLHSETVPAGAEGDAGLHLLQVEASETTVLEPGEYHYDLQWIRPGSPDQVLTLIFSGEQVDGSDIPKIAVLADIRRETT